MRITDLLDHSATLYRGDEAVFDGRTRLSQQVVAEVREHFKQAVFDTVIPRTTRLAEAPSFGKPIIHYDPYSAASAAYEVLAGEVSRRLGLG